MLELAKIMTAILTSGMRERIQRYLNSEEFETSVTNFVLALLATGGVVFDGPIGPTTIKFLGKRHRRAGEYPTKRLATAFYYLKRHGLVDVYETKLGKTAIRLNERGERRLARFALESLSIPRPTKWDGKWRAFLFDIPVRFRRAREALRWQIKELGFYQLQKSVWVHPYPCLEELLFVADFFGVLKYIEVLQVEKVLQDDKLKKHFRLA